MADLVLRPVTDPPLEELAEHLVVRRFLGEQGDPGRAREAADAMVERVRTRISVLDAVGGGVPGVEGAEGADERLGRVWLVDQGVGRAVLRLELTDPALGPQVRELVEESLRGAGVDRLTVGVYPGDPVTEGFTRDAGYETSAVQMRLDLTGPLPAEDVVVLEPMGQAAFEAWEAHEVEAYAEARAKSGESPERALEISRQQHAELLPDGLASRHHAFFVGLVDGAQVGTLWIGTERPMAFVYDVAVDESYRRRGYGAGLMRAGALWAREQGAPSLGLNVFGYNHGARALYEALDYAVVELFVGKVL